MREEHTPLLVAVLALALLPFALDLAGLPLRSAIDVVVFAIACMGLNILLGHTGLVSFGHGAWFGLGAYAAALSQRYWFPGTIILPFLFAILFVASAALLSGALILRRRGGTRVGAPPARRLGVRPWPPPRSCVCGTAP